MASSVEKGFLTGTPFLTKNVKVNHEYLDIKVIDNYLELKVDVIYEIESNGNDTILPIVFYALNYDNNFSISIDGQEIELSKYTSKGTEIVDYNNDIRMLFEGENEPYKMAQNRNSPVYLYKKDLKFFFLPIDKGSHEIKVEYFAKPSIEKNGWVKQYYFEYLISPAKQWRSFGGLTLNINIAKKNTEQFISFDDETYLIVDSISTKEYSEIPGDVLYVKYKQKLSHEAIKLLEIGPRDLALQSGIIWCCIHIILVLLFQLFFQKNSKLKHIIIVIGCIMVSLFICISWVGNYTYIDNVIGKEASRFHGYTFFIYLLFPFILIIDLIIVYIIVFLQKAINKA